MCERVGMHLKLRTNICPYAWFPSLLEQQEGKIHFLVDTEGESLEHKESLTFCQEFDLSEEDCALNESINKKKK